MGGKDVIYAKQQHSSSLQPADVQKKLKDMADKLFIDGNRKDGRNFGKLNDMEKVLIIISFFSVQFTHLIPYSP